MALKVARSDLVAALKIWIPIAESEGYSGTLLPTEWDTLAALLRACLARLDVLCDHEWIELTTGPMVADVVCKKCLISKPSCN